ncbi:cytochrome c oxidase assembly protein [Thiohalorhabdus sp.]|uniref:cytochrome c oxidase assembly protein n=1 Tax=Thiohalorhabdus sp. TaxID=3094134 RepID=UPI002FC37FC5
MEPIRFLSPYDFYPTVLAVTLLVGILFGRGQGAARRAGEPVGWWRGLSFWLGLGLTYTVLQTQLDYLAQHMFWVHRGQHLVLHHLGPILMVLALPHTVMARAVPGRLLDGWLRPLWHHPAVQIPYRLIQHPVVAPLLFVGIIYFWLIPSVHFAAMLSVPYYNAMNWSVLVEGLLFWWLILDPRSPTNGGLGFGVRMIMVWGVMPPQILLGAYIGLSKEVLFEVYDICGRAWPLPPLVDQQLGGLLTWIPASMMSVIAALIVLRMWLRHSDTGPAAQTGTG